MTWIHQVIQKTKPYCEHPTQKKMNYEKDKMEKTPNNVYANNNKAYATINDGRCNRERYL